MNKCLITGSLGLVGSTAVKYFSPRFDKIIGVDNDQRQKFFGTSGLSNKPTVSNYSHFNADIRGLTPALFNPSVKLIIHAAGQPSHDYATNNVIEDFHINTAATVHMLEVVREHCPEAVFIFCSTNKVYGDYPNDLDYEELTKRFDYCCPFDEGTPVDNQLHSFFGCSKLSADMYVQEYGKNLGIKTGTFRAGCITGAGHGGAVLHGFLSYLVKCVMTGLPYTIYGYKGKQVRDNIHAYDLVTAFDEFYKNPRPGEVYNIGGGEHSNCSVLEAIEIAESISGKKLNYSIDPKARTGDHKWWVSDVSKFKDHYPAWDYKYDLKEIISEIVASYVESLVVARVS